MTQTFSPQAACTIASEASGFQIDPKVIRTWRNRGLLVSFQQDGDGWTRYSLRDLFTLSVMALAIKAGYSARTAANVARVARDYAPGTDGSDTTGMLLVFPGITAGGEDDEAVFQHRFRLHVTDVEKKLFSPDALAKFGATFWIIIPISEARTRVLAAVAAQSAT